jgi:hypothetical protein
MPNSHSYTVNELMNLAGAVEQAALIKLIHATFDGELSERAQQMIVAALRAMASPSSYGPESEAVKLLRRCHDAGDLVTPLDETLREDVAAFFGCSSATQREGEKK